MTTSKQHDYLIRLSSISSEGPQSASFASFAYVYNSANQRTLRREADGAYWRYEYDSLGQVKSGKKYWADGTPVAGQQFDYAFDDIGNRTSTKAGGDQSGANLRSATYAANKLNQYSSRTVPGAVDVMGVALATNTVTVDGHSPCRKGEYFRKELSVANTSVPVWKSLTVNAPGETPETRNEFVPQTPESFTHDLDGNLVADGRWNYTWDAENRLVAMAARTGIGPQISLKFEYDAQGRRIRKQVWGNAAWSGSATNDLRFVYDGWNVIAVLSPPSTVLRSFTWGLDLSGSLQGAGGVGGLVAMNVHSGANAGTYFYSIDGNGNVAALISASDSTVAARYEYGPFGELLRATGPMTKANPFRFSTKYQDDETDLLYYGFRYYNASTGRWPNRDPIEEAGGLNLYGMVGNDPVDSMDYLGLMRPGTPTRFDVTAIPGIMTANGWNNGAALQKRWFSNPAIGSQLPDTTTIKMSWVLGYARAKKIYDEIINQKLYVNAAAKAQILKTHGNKDGAFGDFTLPVPVLDKESIQFRVVGFGLTDAIDDLSAALGNFTFRVVVKGCATKGAIGITQIGIYVKDSFDFQGDQDLGYWNKATNYGGRNPFKGTLVSNSDYRAYAQKTGFGGDFLVFSDLVVIKLSPHEVILK